jgi:hypothetical protein
MKGFRTLLIAITGLGLAAALCFGDDSTTTVQLKIKPSGFASIEIGEIVKGGLNKKTNQYMNNLFMKQLVAGLSVDAAFDNRNRLDLGLQMQMYNNYPTYALRPEYRYLYFYPTLSAAEFSHAFGNVDKPLVTASAGYFPFKYNSDVRNLGEYLFRTGTYPQYILNYFDFPFVRLCGVHLNFSGEGFYPESNADYDIGKQLIKNFKLDEIVYTNLQWYAVGDWNEAIIASDKVFDFFEFGLGVSFNSLLSVDSNFTTPRDASTLYHITYNETTGKSDSSFYTFKGTKLMARAAIDFKRLFRSSLFGKNDLRLYGEAAVLGTKNYPYNITATGTRGGICYDSIMERIPIMGGFVFPTFKLLDALSLEVEYFKSPYPNDIGVMVVHGMPIPGQISEGGATDYRSMRIYKNDNLKWSVYATKTFSRYYSATAQVASDHLRPLAVNDENVDFEEALHATNHWYYMVKLTVAF